MWLAVHENDNHCVSVFTSMHVSVSFCCLMEVDQDSSPSLVDKKGVVLCQCPLQKLTPIHLGKCKLHFDKIYKTLT